MAVYSPDFPANCLEKLNAWGRLMVLPKLQTAARGENAVDLW